MKRCVDCDRLLVHDYEGVDDCNWCWLEGAERDMRANYATRQPVRYELLDHARLGKRESRP